jgi:hypothetical protein
VAAWVASLITHTQVGLQFIEGTHAGVCLPEYFRRNFIPAFVVINPSGPAFLQRAAVPQWWCPILDVSLGGDAGRSSAARSVARCFLTLLGAWSHPLARGLRR